MNTSNTSSSGPAAAAAGGGGGDVAYHVTESEFISCHLDTSLVRSVLPAVTAYDRLQPASSNYFIGASTERTHAPILLACRLFYIYTTLRLQSAMRR